MSVDKRTIIVLLAALDLEPRQLAELMGYRKAYVSNVLSGQCRASHALRQAFGTALSELLLGLDEEPRKSYPAGPLAELIKARAATAPCRKTFLQDIGIAGSGWNKREVVTEEIVDRGSDPGAIKRGGAVEYEGRRRTESDASRDRREL